MRLLTDDEIQEYAKDEECRGYPIYSGWLTDEIMPHIKDITKAQDEKTIKYVIDKIDDMIQSRTLDSYKAAQQEAVLVYSWVISELQSLKEELLND